MPETASRILPRAARDEPPPLGMRYTIEQTREALLDPEAFYERTLRPRLHAMLAHGTTTLETKTGYALHKPGETALLDIIARHKDGSRRPAPGGNLSRRSRAAAGVRDRA